MCTEGKFISVGKSTDKKLLRSCPRGITTDFIHTIPCYTSYVKTDTILITTILNVSDIKTMMIRIGITGV